MADRTRPCVIEGCEGVAGKPGSARGMCHAHYRRWQRYGDPLVTRRRRNICSIDGCENYVISHGWCMKHHTRWLRYGDPTHRIRGEIVNGRRVCPKCGVDKPLSEWGTSGRRKSGLSAHCRECMAKRQAVRRADPSYVRSPRNPERDREYTRKWRAKNPDRVRSYTAARRARRQRALVEDFPVIEIFERDGWRCHICGDAIDPSLEYPHPKSASIDHVIPLARGGSHSRENCAAAHLVCNVSKKDRLGVGRGAA